MALAPGTKLGPYEIQSPLGVGGMGEVYRARDTRLERTVAIKILPAQFSTDPVRKQRFEREAKTISSLNHPHICVLHDVGSQDGVDYLVMECVEGETLAKRLEKGPLPLDQALKYGAQIADALDKANRSGVIHRDLKPGNIMLTPTGAKLLDFGLAKPASAPASAATLTAVQAAPVTEEGTIVGTFQYMSPEQVEGKEVDGRSDIFSLGAVLYEMWTGKRAFEGKSQLSVASAILEKEPEPISTAKPMTPPALDHAIKKSLAKLPDERWQSASDLASELKWVAEGSSQSAPVSGDTPHRRMREHLAWTLAVIAGLTALVAGIIRRGPTPRPAEVTRYTVLPPEGGRMLFGGTQTGPVVSPDGRKIAFVAKIAGVRRIWVKWAEAMQAEALAGTEDAYNPFWSPDSQQVGFVVGNELRKTNINGGRPQTVCKNVTFARGASWGSQDVILLGASPGPIYRVAASGGTAEPVKFSDVERKDLLSRFPFFLPDGNHFLYLASSTVTNYDGNSLRVGTLDGKTNKELFKTGSGTAYANGNLLYMIGDALVARPFNAEKLEFSGEPVELARGLQYDPYYGGTSFSVSTNGTVTYLRGKPFANYALRVVDRAGKQIAALDDPGLYFMPRFSPLANQVVYYAPDLQSGKTNVYVWDLASGNRTRLSFNDYYNRTPVWSPDGLRLAFVGAQAGTANVMLKEMNRLEVEQKVAELPSGWLNLTQWTPDGKHLLLDDYWADPNNQRILLLSTEEHGSAQTLIEGSGAAVGHAAVSRDGRWLAYLSDETGRNEVYVTSYPKPAGRIQISNSGGGPPRWRKDGRELLFLRKDDYSMLAAELTEDQGSLHLVSLRPLFQAEGTFVTNYVSFDVSADGTRFVILSTTNEETSAPLEVIVNWNLELKKK